ncbi:hypothetical protein ACFS5N_14020 [Mucilaginibacter ximonensis]|uniref:Lipoprotein n=1 Tax=Mucilaginibacter ximonensis TaxID=538021 RepID=A0ABW5YE36_9SPHI
MIPITKLKFTMSLLLLIAIGCKNKTEQQKIAAKTKAYTAVITKPDYDSLITTPCALVLYPTMQQINKMKKEDGEDFFTIVDDNQFYLAGCQTYLDSVKFKTIVKDSKGTLAFKIANNQLYKLKLGSLSWSIILFDGKTKPHKADITMFDDDFKSYIK